MKRLLQKLTRKNAQTGDTTRYKGGVDSGRNVFVQATRKESRQKKNLLKKLNLYWSQKRSVTQVGFQDNTVTSNWRRKILLVICLLGAVMLFIEIDGVGNITRSLENLTYFRLNSIEVSGVVRASEAQVRSSSGVTVNTSQFSINSEEISTAIMAQNSWVKDVKISRYWPDKLIIRISEHEPHALITKKNNGQMSLYYLNREGQPFIRTGHGMDLDYPVITGLDTELDQEVFREKLEESLYFLRLAQKNDPNLPAQSVSEIHIDRDEGLILHLVEYPFPIFLGKEDIRKKYVRLRQILEVLYKPRKMGMDINRVAYIRMDYLKDKAIVGYTESG